ncbi:uncharacterized protein LOC142230750 [Haematobia irritans]|uniref:uncharacterized protein LOC142230750 n=1 Tax=Haematobia irritans TaxID=7368 RepID=UPI003F5040CF
MGEPGTVCKKVLYHACPSAIFNDETLRGTLIEVEYIINSRPLTFVSLESEDDEAITPNHLLLGSGTGHKAIFSDGTDLRRKCHRIQAFVDQFWKRWVKEYAPGITRKGKWFEMQAPIIKGDAVLIVDENLPRNSWLKGIVLETVVAKEGQVRRETFRTVNGILQRTALKLAVLDVGPRISGKIGDGTALTCGGMLPTADADEIV